jgi:hypothetical protein
MTDKDNHQTQVDPVDGPDENTRHGEGTTFSRRRLIKIGITAAPAVLTLASRPVLAWHCKSPSAWGSEQINPNTSLAPHTTYPNETWTISNWKNNTGRAGLGKPWGRFDSNFSGTNNQYRDCTVSYLTGKGVPLALPSGVSLNQKVYKGLNSQLGWSDFAKYMIVAQLNRHLLASGTWDPQCVTETELTAMVNGAYPTAGNPWNKPKIIEYLYNNWIVRPS